MYCAPMVQLSMTPPLSALTGSMGSSSVMDQFNKQWGSSTGVIFGQAGDPHLAGYSALRSLLEFAEESAVTTARVMETVREPMQYYSIQCEEDLRYIAPSMQLPILLYPPIRQLFEADRIEGYGFEKENLPEEDFYGRLIHNGEVHFLPSYVGEEVSDEFTWEFNGSDPELSFEQLDAIESSRAYLDSWLAAQLGPKGARKDPTNPSNRITKAK